jgi:internalin A
LSLLNINRCDIYDIENLIKLNNLHTVDARNNKITTISRAVAEKIDWLNESLHEDAPFSISRSNISINLTGNPLVFPPSSVIDLGKQSIKSYYESTDKFGYAPLSEGRIIVIGDGSAGKSSLIERILHDTFEEGKNQTNGIRIDNWELKHEDGRCLTFHLWDFGGQEIQHAVHKFFFTDGCLYILVLDNRKEEEPEYWLQQIESLGGSAPVLVVFNKQDDNANEIADRKFLKEKYRNIVGFYNTSCKTGFGLGDFRSDLEKQVVRLRTVDERFPNNWFNIKKTIAESTSGEQHYMTYELFKTVCSDNNAKDSKTQKLLLKYFTTIGAITWFGDTYLNFLHVLSPAWITQGVYKIITSKKTARLLGHINISDFNELLLPAVETDYTYDENHFGYILSMMKKFDLCYTADDQNILLPSAFGKVPKVEYSDFRGKGVRTYVLEFQDYMPAALIHRFIAKKIHAAYDGNYWYSGIVITDDKSSSLAMVQADKDAKRIYVRIKGGSQLGVWEHVRREFAAIAASYASIPYTELIALDDERTGATVSYDDLIGHIQANKSVYFHPKLRKDFNVGYLMGLFESKESTIEKFKEGEYLSDISQFGSSTHVSNLAISILNNNSPVLNNNINVNIDLKLINEIGSSVKGETAYLLEQIGNSNKDLKNALLKLVSFVDDAKSAESVNDVKEKGWTRKLKGSLETIAGAGDKLKKIKDGAAAAKAIVGGIQDLASHLNMTEISHDIAHLYEQLQSLV